MPRALVLAGERATVEFAARVGARILKQPHRTRAVVVALVGELGSGKTTFVKAFARAIGVRPLVTSPTFLLAREYRLPRAQKFRKLFHLDLYRTSNVRELEYIGFQGMVREGSNIIIIEWAEKARSLLPKDTLWIHLSHDSHAGERLATVQEQ